MVNSAQIFAPTNAGLSALAIAEELFDYYTECDKVGEELANADELLAKLTPEACQTYIDRTYDEIDEDMGESGRLELESQIMLDILMQLGLVSGI